MMLTTKEMLVGAFGIGATFLLSKDNRIRNTVIATGVAAGGLFIARYMDGSAGPASSSPVVHVSPTNLYNQGQPTPTEIKQQQPNTSVGGVNNPSTIDLPNGQILLLPPPIPPGDVQTNNTVYASPTPSPPSQAINNYADSILQAINNPTPNPPITNFADATTNAISSGQPVSSGPTTAVAVDMIGNLFFGLMN